MAATAACLVCSRGKCEGHLAKNCMQKSFLQVFCDYCGRPGHTQEACPRKAFEEREQRRKAKKAAFEEREKQRAERAARRDNLDARAEQKAAFEEREKQRAER